MKYKAIFFDRDGTLTYSNEEKRKWLVKTIEEWSDKKFEMDYDKMMRLFDMAGYPKNGLKNIEEEKDFWERYYRELLKAEGINDGIEEKVELLFSELWCNNDKKLYDDVIETMEYFKSKGFKIGVISDTSPSLQLSLENLGLGKYIDSYTCSDLAGVMKPNPLIYITALKSLNVTAEESIYVDDYDIEADGSRNLGFTSFHLDRNSKKKGIWVIKSLKEIIDYVEKQGV